jgi:hypothetical protein
MSCLWKTAKGETGKGGRQERVEDRKGWKTGKGGRQGIGKKRKENDKYCILL